MARSRKIVRMKFVSHIYLCVDQNGALEKSVLLGKYASACISFEIEGLAVDLKQVPLKPSK